MITVMKIMGLIITTITIMMNPLQVNVTLSVCNQALWIGPWNPNIPVSATTPATTTTTLRPRPSRPSSKSINRNQPLQKSAKVRKPLGRPTFRQPPATRPSKPSRKVTVTTAASINRQPRIQAGASTRPIFRTSSRPTLLPRRPPTVRPLTTRPQPSTLPPSTRPPPTTRSKPTRPTPTRPQSQALSKANPFFAQSIQKPGVYILPIT